MVLPYFRMELIISQVEFYKLPSIILDPAANSERHINILRTNKYIDDQTKVVMCKAYITIS
jgi:hypothetical protein